MNLNGANLEGVNLANSQFTRSDLSGANLRGATLNEANFSQAEMAGASFDAASMLRTNLRGAPLVEELEREVGIPIYDTVATAVWGSLKLAGVDPKRIAGWGRLFREVG